MGDEPDELDRLFEPPPRASADEPSPENDPEHWDAVMEFVRRAADALAKSVRENGDTSKYPPELQKALVDELEKECRTTDCFRTKFYKTDRACATEPWKEPVYEPAMRQRKRKAHRRPYTTVGSDFLDRHTGELCSAGLLHRKGCISEPTMAFAIANAVLAKKKALPGADPYRAAWDLRELNNLLEYYHFPTLTAEELESVLSGARYYMTTDLFKAFWQIALARESQELYTLATATGLFTSTRILMGAKNSTSALACAVAEVFEELIKEKKVAFYVDDGTAGEQDPRTLLETFKRVMQQCAKYRLYMNPKKTNLWSNKVEFLGRQASAGTLRPSPDMVQGIRALGPPQTVADLMQFKGMVGWISSHIPRLRELLLPLQNLETELMRDKPRKTKKVAERLILGDRWTGECDTAHRDILEAVANAVDNYIPGPNDRLALFTDASRLAWAGCLLAYDSSEEDLPAQQRNYKIVSWVGAAFTQQELAYGIPEKEVLAAVRSCEKLERYLHGEHPFSLHTDHLNMVKVWQLGRSTDADVSHVQAGRVQRWAMYMSRFNARVFHIEGENNIMADYGSRQQAATQQDLDTEPKNVRAVEDYSFADARVQAIHHEDFQYPDAEEIIQAQQTSLSQGVGDSDRSDEIMRGEELVINGRRTRVKDGLIRIRTGKTSGDESYRIWIPADNESLRCRITVIAHVSCSGHQGITATAEEIRQLYYWYNLEHDVTQLVKSCINCWSSHNGKYISRPLAATYIAQGPFEAVQMDFCKVYEPKRAKGSQSAAAWANARKYMLVIKCKFSRRVMLISCDDADSATAAEGLLQWIGQYGIPDVLITDGGPHFTGKLMPELVNALQMDRVMSLAYTAYSNGSVEKAAGDAVRVCQALCSENRIPAEEWHRMLPLVEHHLNTKKMPSLGGLSPLEVCSARKPPRPLDHIVRGEKLQKLRTQALDSEAAADMVRHLEEIQAQAAAASDQTLAKDRLNKNKRRGKQLILQEGDFVMAARKVPPENKMMPKWDGPHQLVRVDSNSRYIIRDLLSGRERTEHPSRLQRYQDKYCQVSQRMKEQVAHDRHQFVLDAIKSHRFEGTTVQLEQAWKGFEGTEWEELTLVAARESNKVLRYVRKLLRKADMSAKYRHLEEEAKKMCKILKVDWQRIKTQKITTLGERASGGE